MTKKSKQKKTTEKRAKPDKSLKSDLENKSKQRQNVNNNFPGVNNKCPKCGVGTIIKGKTAFGCSEWRNGCDYKVLFSDIN